MDGALESGRYGAHEVAKSLGLGGHAIAPEPSPSKEAAEPAAPPAPSPLLPAHATTLLAAVHDELRSDGPTTGLRGATSYLHDAIVRAMKREGRLPASADHRAELTAVRDFAASVVGHASSDPSAHTEHEGAHFSALREAVTALEAKVAKLLKG